MKSRLRHKIKTGCVNVKRLSLFLVLAAMSCFADKTGLHAARPTLEEGFKSPPMDARPQTWWHWMNGNVSKAGITADLEAMKEIGLGGVSLFDAGCNIPPGPLKFNSPETSGDEGEKAFHGRNFFTRYVTI